MYSRLSRHRSARDSIQTSAAGIKWRACGWPPGAPDTWVEHRSFLVAPKEGEQVLPHCANSNRARPHQQRPKQSHNM